MPNTPGVDLIAIDGPAGVGKSTVARKLAEQLGYYFLSSGMIYRAMAWHLFQRGWRAAEGAPEAQQVSRDLQGLVVHVAAEGRILVNGRDVTDALRTESVSQAASIISTVPAVRALSNQVQRETVAGIGRAKAYAGVILEGRDIGSVVFPDAPHKIFLTAREEVRAQRRFAEEQATHAGSSLEAVRKAMQERDARDAGRAIAPLVPAPDARIVDTSDLNLDQVLERVLSELKLSRPG